MSSYVTAIHKKYPEKVLTMEEHPNLEFDYDSTKMTINPALELSKAMCKVNENFIDLFFCFN
jgi:isocitrate lyase